MLFASPTNLNSYMLIPICLAATTVATGGRQQAVGELAVDVTIAMYSISDARPRYLGLQVPSPVFDRTQLEWTLAVAIPRLGAAVTNAKGRTNES